MTGCFASKGGERERKNRKISQEDTRRKEARNKETERRRGEGGNLKWRIVVQDDGAELFFCKEARHAPLLVTH